MFGVGFLEIVIIAIFALVFVGPKRLPEVMRQAGRLFVHLRRTANDVRSTFDQVIREAENEMRREDADKIRNALKPVTQITQEVKKLVLDDHPLGSSASVVESLRNAIAPPNSAPMPSAGGANPAGASGVNADSASANAVAASGAAPAPATSAAPAAASPAAPAPDKKEQG